MRNRIERLVLLPFSPGCVSESSIAVEGQFPNRVKRNASASSIGRREDKKEEEEKSTDYDESLSDANLKNISSLLAVPKFPSLLKNFKNLSQLFAYKDEEEEEDDMGMDIGFPTDVKHVTHIGIDGSAAILSRGWDNLQELQLNAARPVLSTPSELIRPSQADELNLRLPSENAHHEEHNSLQTILAKNNVRSKSKRELLLC